MSEPLTLLLTAIALIFVIEGLIYALFPDMVRKMMAIAISSPVPKLRTFGLTMAVTGAALAWLVQRFH